ncbi:MAG: metallophosphoesterase [Oscillospiraceae bacterium]|nr:metallophosphoesterase [Oscillospiraceae bacterium]
MGILAFFNGIFLRLVGLFLAGVLAFSGLRMPCPCTSLEAIEPDNLRLNVSVFADVHMQGFFFSSFSLPMRNFRTLRRSLNDLERAAQPVDALVLLGDNTQNGQWLEYVWLFGMLQRYNPARETFVVLGNHDLNLNGMSARRGIGRHNFFWRSYDRNMRGTEAFYRREINGFPFISIAGEGPKCERYISDAQLAWLDYTIANTPANKPVFVFVHQHVHEYLHEDVPFPRAEFFLRAAEVRAILEQRENVFVFNGHWHTIPLSLSVENGVNYINIPGMHSHVPNGDAYDGEGLQIEVYDDRVVMRGRNFVRGEWLEEYFVVDLV